MGGKLEHRASIADTNSLKNRWSFEGSSDSLRTSSEIFRLFAIV